MVARLTYTLREHITADKLRLLRENGIHFSLAQETDSYNLVFPTQRRCSEVTLLSRLPGHAMKSPEKRNVMRCSMFGFGLPNARYFLVFFVLAIASIPAQSTVTCPPGGYLCDWATDEELRVLPSYCSVIFRTPRNDPRHQKINQMNWRHMHHYCVALAWMKRGNWKNAIGQFEYCERDNVAIHSPIVPELFTLKGQAQEKLGHNDYAVQSYRRAIAEKPDHIPAYKSLAELYLRAGMISEAKQVAEVGLRKSPNSKALKRLLGQISGTPHGPGR